MSKITEQDKLYIKQVIGLISDKIKVCCKCLFGEKNSLAAVWKFTYTAAGYSSSAFTFAVFLKDLIGFDKAEIWFKEHWWILIAMESL